MLEKVSGLVLAIAFLAGLASPTLAEEDWSYHGWNGRVEYENGHFAYCTLYSPAPLDEAITSEGSTVLNLKRKGGFDEISVSADGTTRFYLGFPVAFDPQPEEALDILVGLGTIIGSNIDEIDFKQDGYTVKVPKGAKMGMIRVDIGDPIFSHLSAARFLWIKWPDNPDRDHWRNLMNFDVVALRHRSLTDLSTWPNALVTNDTFPAIKEVMDCAAKHAKR
jgi:hypothetical protein